MSKKILLFGSNERGGLELARSLGHAGHHIAILRLSASRTEADFSRFCKASFYLGTADSDVREYTARLAELLFSHRFDYLVPVDNPACELIYFDHEAISSLTRVVGPSLTAYRRMRDRFEALALAEAAGIACPSTILLKRGNSGIPATPGYPCFVRPVLASAIVEDELQQFSVRKVNSVDELDAKLRDDLPRVDVMLQPVVSGPGIGLNCCAIGGDVQAASVTLHLHELRRKGGSSYKESGEVTPEILAAIQYIARQLALTGFMTIECRKEKGRLVFIDMKCWPTDSLSLSVFAGVDFPARLMAGLENGCSPDNSALADKGAYMRHLRKDIRWFLTEPAKAKGGSLTTLASRIGAWNALLSGRERWEIERLDDPLPAIRQFDGLLKSVGARITLRLATALMRTAALQPEAGALKKTSSLLIVCKGNINRSLVAEQLFKARGFTRVQSAGLLGMSGRRPSKQAEVFLCERLGIDGGSLRSKSVGQAMREMGDIDLVLCFERRQVIEMLQRFPKLRGKVFPFSVLARDCREEVDIADPHGASVEAYLSCFQRIERLVDQAAATAALSSSPAALSAIKSAETGLRN